MDWDGEKRSVALSKIPHAVSDVRVGKGMLSVHQLL